MPTTAGESEELRKPEGESRDGKHQFCGMHHETSPAPQLFAACTKVVATLGCSTVGVTAESLKEILCTRVSGLSQELQHTEQQVLNNVWLHFSNQKNPPTHPPPTHAHNFLLSPAAHVPISAGSDKNRACSCQRESDKSRVSVPTDQGLTD